MPTFDAGKSVESLDWNFTSLPDWPKNGPLAKAKGTIHEPSDRQIGDFMDGMKNLYADSKDFGVDLGDDADPLEIMAALDNVTGEAFVKLMDRMAELYAELCSGSPSKDMLLALPMRGRTLFFGWMIEEVVRPEAGSAAGAQVVSLPQRAAAG